MTPVEAVKRANEVIIENTGVENKQIEKMDAKFRTSLEEYVFIAEECYKRAVEKYKDKYPLGLV